MLKLDWLLWPTNHKKFMLFYCFLNLNWWSFAIILLTLLFITNRTVFQTYTFVGNNCSWWFYDYVVVSINLRFELDFKHAQVFSFFMLNFDQIRWKNVRLLETQILQTTVNPSFKLFNSAVGMVCVILNSERQIFRIFRVLNFELYKNQFWYCFELLNRFGYQFYWNSWLSILCITRRRFGRVSFLSFRAKNILSRTCKVLKDVHYFILWFRLNLVF